MNSTLEKIFVFVWLLGFGCTEIEAQNPVPAFQPFDFVRIDQNRITGNDSTGLQHFLQKLSSLQTGGQTNVVLLGNSHVQAGVSGHEIRTRLQQHEEFGNGGRGFLFPYKLAHSNNPANYEVKYTGNWSGCRNVFDQSRCDDCGLAGITATTQDKNSSFSIRFEPGTERDHTFNQVKVYYPDTSHEGYQVSLKLPAGKVSHSERFLAGYTLFSLSQPVHEATFILQKKSGSSTPFSLQGLSFQNQKPGVVLHEIGVNGARAIDYLECPGFRKQLPGLDPDLIIVSLGTNDTYQSDYQDSTFRVEYVRLLQLLKKSCPEASILISTPGDCKRQSRYLNKNNLKAHRVLLEIAHEYNYPVWDWFEIMGSAGSIERWYESGMSARDRIHLNRTGYRLQGELFFHALCAEWYAFKTPKVDSNEFKGWVGAVFSFDPEAPMFFTSYLFWAFFTLCLLAFGLLYKNLKARNLYLLVFSLFFYYKAGGFFFLLLLFSTAADFFIGNALHKSQGMRNRKTWVILSVTLNLGLLAFFKYTYFFADSVNFIAGTDYEPGSWLAGLNNLLFDTHLESMDIILPVGISFYTFQTISYTVDIFRKRLQPVKSIADFAFYVSFFPQLVAGPIVRAADFVPQIYQPYNLSKADFGRAMFLILSGLIKKIVISDYISVNFVDRIFDSPLAFSGLENLLAVYGYSIQIYCDFSGYTDIAIGIALLLGFRLPLNFDAPYTALSITDFWRRWHISLSAWLKDYLYIPLGGNRKGVLRTYVNLFITMLLGGLWHGAALRFLMWGALHGLALGLHKFWKSNVVKTDVNHPVYSLICGVLTFHFVAFCWILFRAENMEFFSQMIGQIAFSFHAGMAFEIFCGYQNVLVIMLLAYLLHLVPSQWEKIIQTKLTQVKLMPMGLAIAVIILILYQFKSAGVQPFIYFQF